MFSSSPTLIAAYHVFLRLSAPRHPPVALDILFSQDELPSQSLFNCQCSKAPSDPAGTNPGLMLRISQTSFHEKAADMVGLERLELSTSRLSGARSSHLSYRPAHRFLAVFFGGGRRNRTADHLLAKQALSRLSYAPAVECHAWHGHLSLLSACQRALAL